ncbi:MAG: hypothetical protein JSV56_13730 [Methanomassiliicoccales archaeon]|nr:MAG: hypothetical protein JSV56_13730 [Methanomassiliicoccales archaeon]
MEAVDLDLMLLFLMLIAYILLLWLGIPIWWSLCITAFIGLLYLGLRYPKGKADWRSSFRETLYIVMTLITMFIFIMAIQAALRSIGNALPSAVEILLFFIVMPSMMILFLLGLFFPCGKALKLRGVENSDKNSI